MNTNQELHVIFGAGPLGKWTARELIKLGKRVRMINRSGQVAGVPAAVEAVKGDAYNAALSTELTQGAAADLPVRPARISPVAGQLPAHAGRHPRRGQRQRRQADRRREPVHVRRPQWPVADRGDALSRPHRQGQSAPGDDRDALCRPMPRARCGRRRCAAPTSSGQMIRSTAASSLVPRWLAARST
jgi:hypothetical protein